MITRACLAYFRSCPKGEGARIPYSDKGGLPICTPESNRYSLWNNEQGVKIYLPGGPRSTFGEKECFLVDLPAQLRSEVVTRLTFSWTKTRRRVTLVNNLPERVQIIHLGNKEISHAELEIHIDRCYQGSDWSFPGS